MLSENPQAMRKYIIGTGIVLALGIATSARAQISIGLNVGITDNAVCVGGGDSETLGVSNTGQCGPGEGFTASPFLQIGPDSSFTLFDASNGAATFTGLATFQSQVDFNGVTSFTDTVSFSGANATFATPTTFTFPSTFQATTTFNGTTNFAAGMTTTNITNSGTINSTNVNVTGSFTAAPGTTINMGGVNRIQGVAAGINDLDAVNVAQLNAATSGITADVTALETLTATHTTQISAIEAVNTTQASQITAIQAVNTTQSSQISALQAAQASVETDIDTLFDLRGRDRRDMKQGVAAAMSMAQAPMPSGPGRVSYSINGATFRGEYAVGAALNFRLNTQAPMAVSVGASFAGNKNNGFRLGVAGEF